MYFYFLMKGSPRLHQGHTTRNTTHFFTLYIAPTYLSAGGRYGVALVSRRSLVRIKCTSTDGQLGGVGSCTI